MPKVETAPKIDGNLSTASERMTQDASWTLHGASHSIVQFIAAYLLAVIIFGLDVFLHRPLLAVLYIVPVALAGFWSRSNQPSRVVVVTGFCTLLVGAGLLVLPSLDSILLTDRLLVLATIWITAILSLLHKNRRNWTSYVACCPCAPLAKKSAHHGLLGTTGSRICGISSCGVQPQFLSRVCCAAPPPGQEGHI